MIAREVRHSFTARWRHPGYWVTALGLLSLLAFYAAALPREWNKWPGLLAFSIWMLNFIPALVGSPAPWQWTGDARPKAPWQRGLLQSCGYAVCWAVWSVLCLQLTPGTGHEPWRTLWQGILVLFLEFFLLLAPIGLIIAHMEWLKEDTQAAQAKARQVRWMSHRGSFSPSLLFSNLKHLADLAHRDALATEQGLVELAELYRQGLIEAEHPLISLAAERELAERYLALERGRWGEKLIVRWHLEPDLEHRLVPPLLLLPLLESLLAPGPGAGGLKLDVHSRSAPGFLILRFVRGEEGPAPSEHALEAILQRMKSLLGKDGGAELSSQPEGWRLELKIPSSTELP